MGAISQNRALGGPASPGPSLSAPFREELPLHGEPSTIRKCVFSAATFTNFQMGSYLMRVMSPQSSMLGYRNLATLIADSRISDPTRRTHCQPSFWIALAVTPIPSNREIAINGLWPVARVAVLPDRGSGRPALAMARHLWFEGFLKSHPVHRLISHSSFLGWDMSPLDLRPLDTQGFQGTVDVFLKR